MAVDGNGAAANAAATAAAAAVAPHRMMYRISPFCSCSLSAAAASRGAPNNGINAAAGAAGSVHRSPRSTADSVIAAGAAGATSDALVRPRVVTLRRFGKRAAGAGAAVPTRRAME